MKKKILFIGIVGIVAVLSVSGLGYVYMSGMMVTPDNDYYTSNELEETPPEPKDTDGDGYPDNEDDFPNDINEWKDSDYDGVGDNSDFSPNNYLEWIDSDGDQIGDNYDPFPNDITKWKDYSIPPEITEFNYDENRFDIYNLRIETFAYNASITKPGIRMGDGFLDVPNDYVSRHVFSFVIKNVAGEDIHEVYLLIDWYDKDGNHLGGEDKSLQKWGESTEPIVLEKDIYYPVFIMSANAALGRWGVHHFTVTFTENLPY